MSSPIQATRTAFYNARSRCLLDARYRDRVMFLFDSVEDWIAELGPRPSPKHSVDRRDNDGHYVPGNLRWATHSEQQLNKRPNSAEARRRQSEAAKIRCTPEWRKEVSDRVKTQHEEKKFGCARWKTPKEEVYAKISESKKGKPGPRKGMKASPETIEKYRAAATLRERRKREARAASR